MAAVAILGFVTSWLMIIMISQVSPTTPPKSVNLAVETSFLFEPDDIRKNDTMLGNVRQFLDKLENLLSPEENREAILKAQNYTNGHVNSEHLSENGKNWNDNDKNVDGYFNGNRLSKFLTELGGIVINYDDDEVKSLASALNKEVARNYATNPKFHDMFHNIAIKLFIKNTVQEWTSTDPLRLKVEIAKYLTSDEGSAFVSFFHNLNPLFENDKAKFKKLVKKFAKARKTKEFAKPLAKTFDLIFERYDKLDDDSKTMFQKELNKLTNHVLAHYKHRLMNNNKFLRRSLNDNAAKDLSESVKEDLKNSDNSIENANDLAIAANELRIDKNVQFSVHTANDLEKEKMIQT